jgi:hypothetical protein
MSIFQIVSVLFALFMIYVVSIHGKKRTLTVMETSFWFSTWGFFIVIATFPAILTGISNALKFSRVFDLLLVVALMVLSCLVFFSYFKQKELMFKIENLVRKTALEKAVSPSKKRKK